jgi:hypothetical protein
MKQTQTIQGYCHLEVGKISVLLWVQWEPLC